MVVTHSGVVVAFYGGGSVVQGGQQIRLDVSHTAGRLVQAVKNVLQVRTSEFQQSLPYQIGRKLLAGDGEVLRFGAKDFNDQVDDLIQTFLSILLAHDVIFDMALHQRFVLSHYAGLLAPAR